MKNIKILLAFLLVVAALVSCTPDVEEHLQLNGQEFLSSVQTPENEEDLIKVMADADEFSIVAVDKSSPAADVETRVWVLKNSYGDAIRTVSDSSSIRLLMSNQGLFSLNLTVNGDVEGSITNWIKVEGEVEGILLNSNIDFISPKRSYDITSDRLYSIVLKASIWEENLADLVIKHNGNKVTDYEFDEAAEQISFMVKLKEGENTVQVSGDIDGDFIDVVRTIEYSKEAKRDDDNQLAEKQVKSTGSPSNKSADAEIRPEQPISSLQEQPKKAEEPVAKPAEKSTTKADTTPNVAPKEEPKKEVVVEVEDDDEEEPAYTKTFDVGYKEKALTAYNQTKVVGIKVASLADLTGDCAMQFGHESFVINISGVKDIMYIESLKLAQNPGVQGTDVTITLECLTTGLTGQPSRPESAVVGYTDNKPMNISLSRLNKMPLLPGNNYRLTIICEGDIELGYVDANKCSGKIDKSDIVKLDYKDGKCPIFSLKLKH